MADTPSEPTFWDLLKDLGKKLGDEAEKLADDFGNYVEILGAEVGTRYSTAADAIQDGGTTLGGWTTALGEQLIKAGEKLVAYADALNSEEKPETD